MNTQCPSIPLIQPLLLEGVSDVSHAGEGAAIRVIPAPHLEVKVNVHQTGIPENKPFSPPNTTGCSYSGQMCLNKLTVNYVTMETSCMSFRRQVILRLGNTQSVAEYSQGGAGR